MIFELAADFSAALAAMPREHPRRRTLELFEEALRRDIHFTTRHPTTLFQSMWNLCWWYDCLDSENESRSEVVRSSTTNVETLSGLLEQWWQDKSRRTPHFYWIRSLRPPQLSLGSGVLGSLGGDFAAISHLAKSPDDLLVATAHKDGTVRVWKWQSQQEISCRQLPAPATLVKFSQDKKQLWIGLENGVVLRCDPEMQAEFTLQGTLPGAVRAISPDGVKAATWSGGGWYTVQESAYDPSRLEMSGAKLSLCDLSTGATLAALSCKGQYVNESAFSPDGKWFAAGDDSGMIYLLEPSAEKIRSVSLGDRINELISCECLAFSKDVSRLYASGLVRTRDQHTEWVVHGLWEYEIAYHKAQFQNQTNSILKIDVDAGVFVEADNHGVAQVFSLENREHLVQTGVHEHGVWSAVFLRSLDVIATAAGHKLWLWKGTSKKQSSRTNLPQSRGNWQFAFAPDGTALAGVMNSFTQFLYWWDIPPGALQMWNPTTGELLCDESIGYVCNFRFSPDSRILAVGVSDGGVSLWSTANGQRLWEEPGGVCSSGPAQVLAYSPNSHQLVVAHRDQHGVQAIKWFEISTGRKLGEIQLKNEQLDEIFLSADSRQFLARRCDQTIIGWDAITGKAEITPSENCTNPAPTVESEYELKQEAAEVEICRRDSGKVMAWHPITPGQVVMHPSGRMWVGGALTGSILFVLEGPVPEWPIIVPNDLHKRAKATIPRDSFAASPTEVASLAAVQSLSRNDMEPESSGAKSWQVMPSDKGGLWFEGNCSSCGHAEEFYPPSGETIPDSCPKCGGLRID